MKNGYQSLIVWQKSMSLAKEVYAIINGLPVQEKFGLSDQLRRAVISIPSNIAEGSRRNSSKEFVQFLHIAHGSLAEVETQLLLASDLYPKIQTKEAAVLTEEIGRMLYVLITKLEQ